MSTCKLSAYRNKTAPMKVYDSWSVKYLGRIVQRGTADVIDQFNKQISGHFFSGTNLFRYINCIGCELFFDVLIRTTFETQDDDCARIESIKSKVNIPEWEDADDIYESDLVNVQDIRLLLDALTKPRVEMKSLEKLVSKLNADKAADWSATIDLEGSNSVTFTGNNSETGRQIMIPLVKVFEIMEWSYTYLEVIFDKEFWAVNDCEYFELRYRDPMQALLHYVDVGKYFDLLQLCENAVTRRLLQDDPLRYEIEKIAFNWSNEKYHSYVEELAKRLSFQGEMYPEHGRIRNGWRQA